MKETNINLGSIPRIVIALTLGRKGILLGISILGIFFLIVPLWLGEDAFITVPDVLDSEFIYFHLLKVSNLLFSLSGDLRIENVMNGLPRNYIHSEFNIVRLLFYWFPSLEAYNINSFLVRSIGFIGMLLLCRDYLLLRKQEFGFFISLLFAFIPLYTIYGISVSGLPLLVWAFLNLKNDTRRLASWAVIVLFPFYAHLALIAPFVIIFLAAYGLYELVIRKKLSIFYWLGIGVLTVLFVVSEVSIISSFLFSHEASQRTEWSSLPAPAAQIAAETFKLFVRGHYHASSFIAAPMLLFLLLTAVGFSDRLNHIGFKIWVTLLLLLGISFFFSAYYNIVAPFKEFRILSSFQFRRFTFLSPFLLFAGFAIAITHTTLSRRVIFFALLLQFGLIAYSNNELKLDLLAIVKAKTTGYYFSQPSFREFFAPEVFSEVKRYIGLPQDQYRVVSVGIHPAVAQYNGFYTLDSYQNNYPLSYKNRFLEIIQPELAKDSTMKIHWNNWGSKCYVLSAEIWKRNKWFFDLPKASRTPIHDLSIRTTPLKDMGCKYIFSAVAIENYQQLQLTFEKEFISNKSFWDIYLYKIN